jgi:hypothetical protein
MDMMMTELAELTGFDVERVRKDYLGRIVVEDVNQKVFHLYQRSLHVYTGTAPARACRLRTLTPAGRANEKDLGNASRVQEGGGLPSDLPDEGRFGRGGQQPA